ncbi:thiamine biosynthesis protein ThiJ [Nocardiopsis sp. CNR-923]|uniref:type 1 glutamine amidotransferase domain-containing protein n=1 Tax=Nocardiopsis sp. CNR-923 TaxID=1904965 RepID=UPI00095C2501|nr:type 1 glutamine amidotransferase domain-containing protein [Nocardiopsis sp. CNR-923]OLT25815.1 thiamine biosynthesis protein ThiJ [Nocardiopsis sp. CNR-923]
MANILFVITGADHWTLTDGTAHPTGFWAEEVVTPYQTFTAAGHRVTVATPGGVVPTVDQVSLTPESNGGQDGADAVRDALAAITELHHPRELADVDPTDFDAVFYPGGHGPMEDLAVDTDSGALLIRALDHGTPLGVVCHGPAALLAATRPDGANAFDGYRVAAFTNTEEAQVGFADKAPWLLQDRLTDAGLTVQTGEPWAPNVVTDRTLVTGQNPASSGLAAAQLLTLLR